VAEQKNRFVDRLYHRRGILALILETVSFGLVRFTPAATGDGVDRELLHKRGLHELPVGRVVAEGAVNEHQGSAAPVLVVGDGDAGG
jgi:hypothetical protein